MYITFGFVDFFLYVGVIAFCLGSQAFCRPLKSTQVVHVTVVLFEKMAW